MLRRSASDALLLSCSLSAFPLADVGVMWQVVQCFTELQLRAELKRMLTKEERRIQKEGKTTVPQILLAKMHQVPSAPSLCARAECNGWC